MSTLLHIDSSPLYGRSVSRELTACVRDSMEGCAPMERSLTETQRNGHAANQCGMGRCVYTPEQARTLQQKELLLLSIPARRIGAGR